MKTYKVIENHYGRRFFFSYILKSFRRRREPLFFFWSIIFFFSGGRAERRQFPFCRLCVATSKFSMRVNIYAIAYSSGVSYLISSLAVADFEAKHFSGIENLTSVYMCIGYVCGCGCERQRRCEANVEWRRGVYGYSTTMSAADLQTGDEIVRRLWWVQNVYLPYLLEVLIDLKLVGDCRDTSSLSVRRPCRKVVNWVYHTSISFVATRFCCWQRKKLRHLPYTPISATQRLSENWYLSFYRDAGNGKTRHDISHKTARLPRLSFRRARHQRPGGICSLAQLVVRVMLFTSLWDLGTRNQLSNATWKPTSSIQSLSEQNISWPTYIYIHIYNYTTIQIHTKVPNTIK